MLLLPFSMLLKLLRIEEKKSLSPKSTPYNFELYLLSNICLNEVRNERKKWKLLRCSLSICESFLHHSFIIRVYHLHPSIDPFIYPLWMLVAFPFNAIYKIQSSIKHEFFFSFDRRNVICSKIEENEKIFLFFLTGREHVLFVCLRNIIVIVGVERFLISNEIFWKCINKIQAISMQISLLRKLFGEWAQEASSNELCLFNFIRIECFGCCIVHSLYVSNVKF